jgi:surface antigen
VKNLMAIGKLFRTTVIVSLLAPALSSAQFSADDSVTGPFNPGDNYVSFMANLINYRGGLLDSYDKKLYMESLMVMLDNVPNGQVMEWRSEKNQAVYGHMRVVYGYQTSNGYCRVYQSEVFNDGYVKSWQEFACRSLDKPRWEFFNK